MPTSKEDLDHNPHSYEGMIDSGEIMDYRYRGDATHRRHCGHDDLVGRDRRRLAKDINASQAMRRHYNRDAQ